MRVSMPWSKCSATGEGSGFSLMSCNPCGAFSGGGVTKIKEHIDETDNTTLSISTHSPSQETQRSSNSNTLEKVAQNEVATESSSPTRRTFDNEIEVEIAESTACQNVRYLVEDATLCLLDGVCCRRTCDDNDDNSLLPETCGGARRELRRRRHDRVHKQSQFCCTTISWGPDDEEDVSVLQDPIVEDSEYDGGLNREYCGGTPQYSVVADDITETPKHRNSFRNKHEKCCAYCGVTKEEAKHRMKMCSRCKSTYYCSKSCQYEDWYTAHNETCVPIELVDV